MSSAQGQSGKCSSVWIHCNRCFENYADKQRTIYILSCYDVACEKCIIIVSNHEIKCLICKKAVKGYPIGNNLTANLKELFHPRPWSLSFPKAWAVLKFQTKQRDNFLAGCRKMKEFNKSMAKERDRLMGECKQIYLLDDNLKKEKAKLTAGLTKLKEISLSRKHTHRKMDKSRQVNDFSFGMQQMKRNEHQIPSTCHDMMSRSRSDDTFDFPDPDPESSLSKSFYL